MFWFTADFHFNHANILELAHRPFATLEEMTETLIEKHNAVVRPKDTVFILGDVALGLPPRHLANLLRRMRGRKKLLYGNHDRVLLKKADKKGVFDDMKHDGQLQILGDYHELKIGTSKEDQIRIILFHYPLASWNAMTYGAWHFHGHCHGRIPKKVRRRMCVGVDYSDYAPVSLDVLLHRDVLLSPAGSLGCFSGSTTSFTA